MLIDRMVCIHVWWSLDPECAAYVSDPHQIVQRPGNPVFQTKTFRASEWCHSCWYLHDSKIQYKKLGWFQSAHDADKASPTTRGPLGRFPSKKRVGILKIPLLSSLSPGVSIGIFNTEDRLLGIYIHRPQASSRWPWVQLAGLCAQSPPPPYFFSLSLSLSFFLFIFFSFSKSEFFWPKQGYKNTAEIVWPIYRTLFFN
jgi:hypothetical protein